MNLNRRSFLLYTLCLANSPKRYRPGDIFLTRNSGREVNNASPGYYNHSAILTVKNWVVESQGGPKSVVIIPIWNFFERYPEVLTLRPKNPSVAQRTANVAPRYVGRGYDSYMSIRPFWKFHNTDSCVSLIKRIYNHVVGKDYFWVMPDSLFRSNMFNKVGVYKNENFTPPKNFYKNTYTVWLNQDASLFY